MFRIFNAPKTAGPVDCLGKFSDASCVLVAILVGGVQMLVGYAFWILSDLKMSCPLLMREKVLHGGLPCNHPTLHNLAILSSQLNVNCQRCPQTGRTQCSGKPTAPRLCAPIRALQQSSVQRLHVPQRKCNQEDQRPEFALRSPTLLPPVPAPATLPTVCCKCVATPVGITRLVLATSGLHPVAWLVGACTVPSTNSSWLHVCLERCLPFPFPFLGYTFCLQSMDLCSCLQFAQICARGCFVYVH